MQAIAFAVFIGFCAKYVWPPLMRAIENRQKQIADGLAAGRRAPEPVQSRGAHRADDDLGQDTFLRDHRTRRKTQERDDRAGEGRGQGRGRPHHCRGESRDRARSASRQGIVAQPGRRSRGRRGVEDTQARGRSQGPRGTACRNPEATLSDDHGGTHHRCPAVRSSGICVGE